jgi:hypothetical protein
MEVLAYDLKPNPRVKGHFGSLIVDGRRQPALCSNGASPPASSAVLPIPPRRRVSRRARRRMRSRPSLLRMQVEALGIPYMHWRDLLPRCDVISLHVPLLPSTHHFLDVRGAAAGGAWTPA